MEGEKWGYLDWAFEAFCEHIGRVARCPAASASTDQVVLIFYARLAKPTIRLMLAIST
jgi:hypothetical protein